MSLMSKKYRYFCIRISKFLYHKMLGGTQKSCEKSIHWLKGISFHNFRAMPSALASPVSKETPPSPLDASRSALSMTTALTPRPASTTNVSIRARDLVGLLLSVRYGHCYAIFSRLIFMVKR